MVTSLSSKTTSNPDINPSNKCKAALSIQILSQTDVICSINRCMVQKLSHKLAVRCSQMQAVNSTSSHPPLINWADWTRRCRRLPDSQLDSLLSASAEEVEQSFLALLTGFLQRTLTVQDLTPVEMQYWIQCFLPYWPHVRNILLIFVLHGR